MDRHIARKEAVCLLFDAGFNPEKSVEQILADASAARDLEADEYISAVLSGVMKYKEQIDAVISAHLKGWAIGRLSKIVLAILRLAVFEIDYRPDIPDGVSVNEAVELAKKYGEPKDASFINGLLGSYLREKGEKAGD